MPYADIAQIAVEKTSYSFDMLFDYLIPDHLIKKTRCGCRVLVGFGKGSGKRQGFVFSVQKNVFVDDNTFKKLKKIDRILDDEPVLNDDIIALARFVADRTFCTYFESAKAMLPSGMCMNTVETYTVSGEAFDGSSLSETEKQIVDFINSKNGYVRKDVILKNLGLSEDCSCIEALLKKGILSRNTDAFRRMNDATVRIAVLSEDYEEKLCDLKLTVKQKNIVELLKDIGSASVREICYFTGVTPAVTDNLNKKGIIEYRDKEVFRTAHSFDEPPEKKQIILSDMQIKAFRYLKGQLDSEGAAVSLLFGVTGSGKTQVYISLIDCIADTEKSVIVMVPEISLTPQLLEMFYSRYGQKVAVLHSGLSYGERLDEWKRVKNGSANIVIGTRSAVFAPVDDLALIIMDEEQESTYKSEMSPRYHARDAAKFRCAYSNALLVLASATPSIETYAAAQNGRYGFAELSQRYSDSGLPEVKVVDVSQKSEMNNMKTVSSTLAKELAVNLEKKQQSILLINRRGFNTFAACSECKTVLTCPNCSISLTYHSANNRLMCHYCGYSRDVMLKCPECGGETVKYSGFGTQKVEQELKILFPDASVLRMDADTTSEKNSHEVKFKEFSEGKYDIMIGTQMVAKGLNFPNVTLVGVISVDQQLYDDDFRSLEKTFDLLTQVVGRSGRGKNAGRAVIQTLSPDNEIISFAAKQDYKRFYNTEIAIRRGMTYPPFCDICVIGFIGAGENYVRNASRVFLMRMTDRIKKDYADLKLIILGPVEPKISKISNKYRERIIIKCKNSQRFRQMVSQSVKEFSSDSVYGKVTVFADMNPESTF